MTQPGIEPRSPGPLVKLFKLYLGGIGVFTFSKDISLKVNTIVCLLFKLTHFRAAVQHFSYYTIMIPSPSLLFV